MSIIANFFHHEINQINHDIERVRVALESSPSTSEQELLDQLEIRKAIIEDVAKYSADEHVITEIQNRIKAAETQHQHDREKPLSDAWWDSLDEIQILSSLQARLKHAIEKKFVPRL